MNVEAQDIHADIFQNIEEYNSQTNVQVEDDVQGGVFQNREVGNKAGNQGTQQQTPTQNIDVAIDIPIPFKKMLFWPKPKSDTKLKKSKVKLPSVATSDSWRSYYENKENKKKKGEIRKEARTQRK
ncbi:hypothetical protein QE152_g4070 [Popillia japonica]|uniref:Uncharacterized protein n=1 Tax=Popillia japonica TaxID=7064 RepID=A0AAW1N1Q3_POPJA